MVGTVTTPPRPASCWETDRGCKPAWGFLSRRKLDPDETEESEVTALCRVSLHPMGPVREGLPRVEQGLMWNSDGGAEGEEEGGQDQAMAALSVGGGIPTLSPNGAVQDQDRSRSLPGFGSSGTRTEHLH